MLLLAVTGCPGTDEGDESAGGTTGTTGTTGATAGVTGGSTSDTPAATTGGGGTTAGTQDSTGGSGDTSGDSGGTTVGVEPTLDVDQIEWIGKALFPEGIASDGLDFVYVGGVLSGEVQVYDVEADTVDVLLPPGSVETPLGLKVRDDVLWVCEAGAQATPKTPPGPSMIRGFDLATRGLVATHAFPVDAQTGLTGTCNDLAFDDDGNLFITDFAMGRIMRVGAADLLSDAETTIWVEDDAWAPVEGAPGSINGIVFGDGAVWTVNFADSMIYRIDVAGDGSAGDVSGIEGLDAASGDGLLWVDGELIIVQTEPVNRVVAVTIGEGMPAVRELASDLDQPSTVTVVRDRLCILEGQLFKAILGQPPNVPFRAVCVEH